MKEKLHKMAEMAKDTLSRSAHLLGDLNADGKVDEEDARIAAEWAKKTAQSAANEVSKLGKEALKSDMVKDAAAGAVVGAAIGVPLPVIGPMSGAAIGAGLGIYKNITRKDTPPQKVQIEASVDVHAELIKLDELRKKGIITDVEFETKKKSLL